MRYSKAHLESVDEFFKVVGSSKCEDFESVEGCKKFVTLFQSVCHPVDCTTCFFHHAEMGGYTDFCDHYFQFMRTYFWGIGGEDSVSDDDLFMFTIDHMRVTNECNRVYEEFKKVCKT